MNKLEENRKKISEIDRKIVKLIAKRMEMAKRIGEVKRKKGLPIINTKRESVVIENVRKYLNNSKVEKDVVQVFRHIIAACRNVQQKIKIAYLGPSGTFTHNAAVTFFSEAEFIPKSTIEDAFNFVERSKGLGVIPLENSTQGSIRETMNLLLERDVYIVGETIQKINQRQSRPTRAH